jgi:hypothetical protein
MPGVSAFKQAIACSENHFEWILRTFGLDKEAAATHNKQNHAKSR